MNNRPIILKKVKVNNLKEISIELEANTLTVLTGVSGSGKSSFAFDTLYMEGQRRFIESLPSFARRQIGEMAKPDLEIASGLSPPISIEQKSAGKNPRSTVGTMTEIYDFLRVLYARIGKPHCPVSGEQVSPQSKERIIHQVQHLPAGTKLLILAPYAKGKKGEFREDFRDLLRRGFTKARVDGRLVDLEEDIALDGNLTHDVEIVIDRLVVSIENRPRIAESMTSALNEGQGICIIVMMETEQELLFSMHAYSPKSGLSYPPLEPHDFSFNSPLGMCPRCHGLGQTMEFDLEKVLDPDKSIAEDCCLIASPYQTVRFGNIYDNLARLYGFKVTTPWKQLSEKAQRAFLYGTEKKWTRMTFIHPETGAQWTDHVQWKGVFHEAHRRFGEAKSEHYRKRMQELMHEETCPACRGERLKPYPAATKLQGKRIYEINTFSVLDCYRFFTNLNLTAEEKEIAEELVKEIRERLSFLLEVGLHYLTLDRTAPTLSGGESQRVRLAAQIGSGLVGITYILDEPSIGLHPRDNHRLISTLKKLRAMGNTVIVVEHDEETIWEADRVVDFGPGAGIRGGEILVNGTHQQLLDEPRSWTGAYLSGKAEIPIPKKRRKRTKEALKLKGCAHHNLKNIAVDIPLGLFIAVTGVSGSGKSSLITDTLFPILDNILHRAARPVGSYQKISGAELVDKVIAIDQSPIGRNPRSNPSTYTKIFDEIRDLYEQLPESRARGFGKGRFSFNVKEGSCPQCQGMGMMKVDMDFMEDAWVTCTACDGKRFDEETLSITYKGKTIFDILEMEISAALEHFSNIPSIRHKLETLQRVGMDYIKLGQSSTTLSGGEAQRIKLAKELVRPATGRTLYIFDEPTTGLHFHDTKQLLEVLHELVDRGNTVIVIEHNMDLVKTADWIIDLGPEGGGGGGELVAAGTPEKIAKMNTPTGQAVAGSLYCNRKELVKKALEKEQQARPPTAIEEITVIGCKQNNLKDIDATIPREKITICTGPSGSGKSSFAFETIYAEGQRRYIESLSPYARQFVKQMAKPKVDFIEGLSPAIAIEQKIHAGNPRSTVGTQTEIYDYLRLLFAHLGVAHSPETKAEIRSIDKTFVVNTILEFKEEERLQILAPIALQKQENFSHAIARLQGQGYVRIRLNGQFYELDDPELPAAFDPKRKNQFELVIDRLVLKKGQRARLFEAVEKAVTIGDKKLIVVRETEELGFNLAFADPATGKAYPEITPHTFSFNAKEGMCPDCQGLGYQYGADLTKHSELMDHSVISLLQLFCGWKLETGLLKNYFKEQGIDFSLPLKNITKKHLQFFMNGAPPDQWQDCSEGFSWRWTGINHLLAKLGKSGQRIYREPVIPLLDEIPCLSCGGTRLNPLARHVTINDVSISDLCAFPIEKAHCFVGTLKPTPLLKEVIEQLKSRLAFLCQVGVDYLSLDRRAPTLSGGEAQRIRLARQLGCGLTGVLYVLDEPTIGLHPGDIERLNTALANLKNLGTTLLMVEHDPLTLQTADYLLDFGPQSGAHGGYITSQGTLEEIKADQNSLTGAYLSGRKQVPVPNKRRSSTEQKLHIHHSTAHNLKKVSVDFPLGQLTCITGVSGSGKSSLMHDVLLPAARQGLQSRRGRVELPAGGYVDGLDQIDKIVDIDQNPIGLTSRSDICSYTDVLTHLRYLFAEMPLAKSKGLLPRYFSYNHPKGMCTNCWGLGFKRIQMVFLPSVQLPCTECHGLKLNPVSLRVTYKGKNLGEYLNMTIAEAREVFEHQPRIRHILDTLISIGLGYLKLGQEMQTLSGGEAQRIKLSRDLAKRSKGHTLYLIDEPTRGLHSDDIVKLLDIFHRLVDKGHTIIMIEHHVDMIRNADWVIDLGPGAGEHGGQLVAQGTPEQIKKNKKSKTGEYL